MGNDHLQIERKMMGWIGKRAGYYFNPSRKDHIVHFDKDGNRWDICFYIYAGCNWSWGNFIVDMNHKRWGMKYFPIYREINKLADKHLKFLRRMEKMEY